MNNVTLDIEHFKGYCKKYKVRNVAKIVAGYKASNKTLVRLAPEYTWQKVGNLAFLFEVEGRKFKIEVSEPNNGVVTTSFLGIEGVNWTLTK